ncbi:MAG: SIMPL domain-containing protein [Chloroflexota bacterium]
MNKTYGLLSGMLAAALVMVVLVGCTTAQAAPQAAATPEAPVSDRYITVVGIGQVSLVPDIAEVNVGVEAAANTVAEAKSEVDRRMEAILTVLKEMGIAEKDIQTSHYSIYFERDPSYIVPREETSQASEGVYRVSNMLQVTIRDLGKVSQLIDAVVEAGANQMYGVSFTVSDDAAWQSQAREKAMADAQARAEELAGLASVELGQVLSVSEVVGGSPYYAVQREAAYGGAGITPGELEFSAQIQVTFAIQ